MFFAAPAGACAALHTVTKSTTWLFFLSQLFPGRVWLQKKRMGQLFQCELSLADGEWGTSRIRTLADLLDRVGPFLCMRLPAWELSHSPARGGTYDCCTSCAIGGLEMHEVHSFRSQILHLCLFALSNFCQSALRQ
jgi:hypothetical protein